MNDIEKILNFLDDEEVIQVTREMVAIPSLTHNEGMGMVRYLERWFKDLDIPVRIYPCENDRANFFADYGAIGGPGRFRLAFFMWESLPLARCPGRGSRRGASLARARTPG